jgi:hypothetical protein
VFTLERRDIEGRMAEEIAVHLTSAFDCLWTRGGCRCNQLGLFPATAGSGEDTPTCLLSFDVYPPSGRQLGAPHS